MPNWAWFVLIGGVILLIVGIVFIAKMRKARSRSMASLVQDGIEGPQVDEALTDPSVIYNNQDPALAALPERPFEDTQGPGGPYEPYDSYY